MPENVDRDKLDVLDGQLVTPYVTEVRLSVFDPPEWVSDYAGKIPTGMKFVLSRDEDGVEYVFGFPK